MVFLLKLIKNDPSKESRSENQFRVNNEVRGGVLIHLAPGETQ